MVRTLISSGSKSEHDFGFSRAVVQDDWCFVTGMTGPDPGTGIFPESVVEQVRNALNAVEKSLKEAGFAVTDVVRVKYYIGDHAYWSMIGPVLGEVFGNIRPACTCLICGLVDPAIKIEIEVTAFRTDSAATDTRS